MQDKIVFQMAPSWISNSVLVLRAYSVYVFIYAIECHLKAVYDVFLVLWLKWGQINYAMIVCGNIFGWSTPDN